MKKLTFIFALVGMLFVQPLSAQIKVLSNGNVKMGCLSSSTSTTYSMEAGFSKIRIHPAATAIPISGTNPYDIYIYGQSETIGGGFIMATSSTTPNANPIKCTAIIDGDNLQIGTSLRPVAVVQSSLRSVNSSGVSVVSDRRFKNNIRNLESGLSEILQLQPVRFDYKQRNAEEYPWDSLARLNKVGFIAQDVEPLIPEAVSHDVIEDFYSLNQTDFIPYIVAGIQELNAIIKEQQARIEEQESKIEELQTLVLASEETTASAHRQNNHKTAANVGASTQDNVVSAAPSATINENKLWSNTPNPFKQETHIRYALTNNVQNAQLCIYNLNGEQIACHRLSNRGQNDFTLRAGSLRPGIYLYSLIADGNVVDTHRMVVTE